MSAETRRRLESWLNEIWYERQRPPTGLVLLSLIYRLLVAVRRRLYAGGWLRSRRCGRPVVIVGNLTAGGGGKTPLVIWLVERLRERGMRSGVISRGYGGTVGRGPKRVVATDSALLVGDEPLLIARRTGAPVVVGSDRVGCARSLAREVDLVVSDDGLQHLALARDLEIVVVDAGRDSGNGRLLPAGPLREGLERLRSADFVIRKGDRDYQVRGGTLANLRDPDRVVDLGELDDRARIDAVAGIARPQAFFDSLAEALGREVATHPFPDHHRYVESDLSSLRESCVVMTEKDAVKCAEFAGEDWWFLPVTARIADPLARRIDKVLDGLIRESRAQA